MTTKHKHHHHRHHHKQGENEAADGENLIPSDSEEATEETSIIQDGQSQDVESVNVNKSSGTQSQPQPPPLAAKAPAKRTPCILLGFKKIWILVWKCLLLRKRAWVLFLFEIGLSILISASLTLVDDIGAKMGVDFSGRIDANEIDENVVLQLICKHGGKLYYAPSSKPGGTSDADKIAEKILEKMAKFIEKENEKRKNIYYEEDDKFKLVEMVPMKNEAAIEKLFRDTAAKGPQLLKDFIGAVIFEKVTKTEVHYKIRFPWYDENFGYNYYVVGPTPLPPTTDLFQSDGKITSIQKQANYRFSGFLGLQLFVDYSAAEVLTGANLTGNLTMKNFPIPEEKSVGGKSPFFLPFAVAVLLIFMFTNAFLVKNVVGEKETGVKELMKLSGYPGWMQWLAWYIIAVLQGSLNFALMIAIWFNVPMLNKSHPLLNLGDPYLWFFVFLLAIIANASFVFFLCSFFKTASLATGIILVFTFIMWIGLPYSLYDVYDNSYHLTTVVAIAVLPHGCLSVAIKYLASFEQLGMGAQWDLIEEELPGHPDFHLGHIMWMFAVEAVVYMCVGVYIENILPSQYGVKKPWYYPMNPIIALFSNIRSKSRTTKTQDQNQDEVNPNPSITLTESTATGFEPHNPGTLPGVVVNNIVKKFGKDKIAVNGVTLKMYEGEIFALLGHNGAGKTTLISVLTGMFAATSGTATISGYDIKEDIEMVRKSLGLCPQHNMLFNNLTVMEHLKLFGAMKGGSSTKEATELLRMIQLLDKADTASMNLSGGQKRKLCLAMALCGGASVVFLDEPSSGMDPEARRVIWDVLLKIRKDKTILLTTHFMEEADVLGDRIEIMAEGQIKCYGSSAYLKSFYGTGYTLKIALFQGGDRSKILELVQKQFPDASEKPIDMAHEIFISLPTETTTSSALSSLFSMLTEKKKELRIESLGLSVASLDEVFLKVGEESNEDAISKKPLESKSQFTIQDSTESTTATIPIPNEAAVVIKTKRSGMTKLLTQTLAILVKKFSYTRRKMGLLLFMLLYPAFMMLTMTLIVSLDIIKVGKVEPPLEMTLDKYSDPVSVYSGDNKNLKTVLGSSSKYVENIPSTVESAMSQSSTNKRKYIVGGEWNGTKYTAWFNPKAYHSTPLTINIASNARLKDPKKFKIRITSHPLQVEESLMILAAMKMGDPRTIAKLQQALSFMMIFTLMPLAACFIVQPIEERLNQSKQLQFMTGINPLIYWVITFLWDLFTFLVITTIMITFIATCETYGYFTSHDGLRTIFILVMSFGFFAISLAYFLSHLPKTVAGGVILLTGILTIPIFFKVIAFLMANPAELFTWLARLFPLVAVFFAFDYFSVIAAINSACNFITPKVDKMFCNLFLQVPGRTGIGRSQSERVLISQGNRGSCCKDCRVGECFVPFQYITDEMFTRNYGGKHSSDGSGTFRIPGMKPLLVLFFAMSAVLLILHIFIEFGGFRFFRRLLLQSAANQAEFLDQVDDDDVRNENARVRYMLENDRLMDDALIVDNLSKTFGSFSAVSRLTFGVHHGECFGLLGVNGAGKTTTFRMITGDEIPSCGNACQGHISLGSNRSDFLSRIGYCPQFDAFVPCLSGRENLLIFALLRGIPWGETRSEVQKWLEMVGLEKDGNKPCQNYSGGMKRRLSAAVAMIAEPGLILLDEPTSGVDPVSRRQFWKVVKSVKGTGQAIILTSHSMDECEVLCSRLGIMVNGQLQCLGGVQHLKHKFALGYTITLKLKVWLAEKEMQQAREMLDAFHNEIVGKFQPCSLKEQHETVLEYQVANASLGWDVLYNTLEEMKKSFEFLVEDYSVNETTLEEVFLAFSRRQYGLRETRTPIWKQCLTCQC